MSCFCCCAKKEGKKATLSQANVEDLGNATKFTEREIQEWYKTFMSDHPDGFAGKDEVREKYAESFPDGDASAFVDQIFRTFDINNDGKMNFKEFLVALSLTLKGTPEQKLRWAFAIYDIDNSGTIDVDELREIFKALDQLNPDNKETMGNMERVLSVLKKMDIDGDGLISTDEFIHGIDKCPDLIRVLGIL